MMPNYLEKALRAWWRTAWVTLEAFQKRYVESGYKDSSSWPNNILFQSYEWAVVNRIAQEDARLRSRLLEPVVTALGATTTMSLEAVGREFLDQAWHRLKTGKLLVGDPDDTFSQIYAVIEPWIRAEKALPYEALTLLYNVRVEGQIGDECEESFRRRRAFQGQHHHAPARSALTTSGALAPLANVSTLTLTVSHNTKRWKTSYRKHRSLRRVCRHTAAEASGT
jgi:hypothetical protein